MGRSRKPRVLIFVVVVAYLLIFFLKKYNCNRLRRQFDVEVRKIFLKEKVYQSQAGKRDFIQVIYNWDQDHCKREEKLH